MLRAWIALKEMMEVPRDWIRTATLGALDD